MREEYNRNQYGRAVSEAVRKEDPAELEKYYIYLSNEEVELLEGMLEDCKRRKREYTLDDVGSTV